MLWIGMGFVTTRCCGMGLEWFEMDWNALKWFGMLWIGMGFVTG
jgi:multidrug transporter EmrE-like cation transporter